MANMKETSESRLIGVYDRQDRLLGIKTRGPNLDFELMGGVPGLVNWRYENTRQIAAAYLGAMAGDLRGRVMVAMDSFGAGTGSTNNVLVNARSKSWPRLLTQYLKAAGASAYDTWAGGSGSNGANLASYLSYDPRVTFGSAASLNATWWGCAGNSWHTGTDAVNGWVELTPGEAFDTVDVVHHVASGTGVFQMLDQALVQAGANISTVAGTNGAAETTITFPAGSTKARARYVSTAQVMLSGMQTRDSKRNGIEVINTSISGIETNFFNAQGGNDWGAHRACVPVLLNAATEGRQVYIIGGGYNDIAIGGNTVETVKARMRSRINYLRSLARVPDIVVMGYCKVGTQSEAWQLTLREALRSVAVDEFDLPFVDPYAITEGAAAAVTKGFLSADNLHMRAAYQGLVAATFQAGMKFAADLQY